MAKGMKIRARARDGMATVKALMTHPMETGGRKDKKTGQNIPAHFIQEITAEINGKNVLTGYWSGGVSQNPYLSFKVGGAKKGDKVRLSWVDNKGQSDSLEAVIG